MRRFAYLLSWMLFLFFISCETTPPPAPEPRRPLTEKELSILVEQGDQAATLRLNKTCKVTGRIEDFPEEYYMRIRAAAIGSDVAQILYTRNGYGGQSYDVRFWTCPANQDKKEE